MGGSGRPRRMGAAVGAGRRPAERREGGLRGSGRRGGGCARAGTSGGGGWPSRPGRSSPRRPMEAARRLLLVLLLALPGLCAAAGDAATARTPGSSALPARTPDAQEPPEAFEPAQGESGAVQPVVGISQRVKTRPSEKKDLGTLGYVLGIIMVVVLIGIGVGIVLGYLYKRGKDLKAQREQKANEREMQRITLPLSAFSNPACELVEENVIVVHTDPTPVEEIQGGNTPLMGQAGTPGA